MPASLTGQTTTAAKSASKTTAAKRTPASFELKTDEQKASYALGANIGVNIANGVKRDQVAINDEIFLRGVRDGLLGKSQLSEKEINEVLQKLQAELRVKMEAHLKALGEANQKEGEAFLAANKTKEGVITLPSGLQYKVLQQGNGPKPKATDTVVCNYRGTLLNGTEFDSSYKRKQPATFPVSGIIKGWSEILQLMPVGSKYQVFIPATLAYGARGPAEIGPNATLIFEIELLSIKEKAAAKAAPATTAKPETSQPTKPAASK